MNHISKLEVYAGQAEIQGFGPEQGKPSRKAVPNFETILRLLFQNLGLVFDLEAPCLPISLYFYF